MLKDIIKQNDEILYKVTHVAKSGMSRHIQFFKIKDNNLLNLTYNICDEFNYTFKDKTRSLYIQGCGMDMGFHVIYNLSRDLFKDGYKLKYRMI